MIQFPVLHRIAIRVVPTPDANGFQVRCFSSASTINAVLQQSFLTTSTTTTSKLEILILVWMTTLVMVNAEWIKMIENQGGIPAAEGTVVNMTLQ